MTAQGKEAQYYSKVMEAGATSCLVKSFNSPENKTDLRETIRRVTQRALLIRNEKLFTEQDRGELSADMVLEKLVAKYTLVVDLKAMRVYFKGIRLPSGKKGIQQSTEINFLSTKCQPGHQLIA